MSQLFSGKDTLPIAAKHAKGMSLRDDAILPSPIVADIIHRICQAKGIGVSFYLRFQII